VAASSGHLGPRRDTLIPWTSWSGALDLVVPESPPFLPRGTDSAARSAIIARSFLPQCAGLSNLLCARKEASSLMRLTTVSMLGMLAIGAGALLPGCSSGSASSAMPNSSAATVTLRASGHILLHSRAERIESQHNANPMSRPKGDKGNLYVSDVTGDVDVLENGTYTAVGSITSGLNSADGEWTDSHKNLYVANYRGNVQEYSCKANKCGSTPTFTYDALEGPVNVTTDRSGNVFVIDPPENAIVEFPQGSDSISQECSLPGPVTGAAVDSSTGDVFVAYDSASSITAYIVEFAGGLSGCSGTTLTAPIDLTGDLILDNHKNIIVCDQWNAVVDVIAPPYTGVTKTIGTGWIDPFEPALEKHGKKMLLYIEDSSTGASASGFVGVYKYPAGTLVTTIKGGTSGPFHNPYGVTDTFNYVP
jgi:hypothetical protein